jgi:hypothetical protein
MPHVKKEGGACEGTHADPWVLSTPPGSSEYTAFRDEENDPPALVVQVGKTELRYHLRALDDLHAMLKTHGDWMPLGSADEQKPARRHRRGGPSRRRTRGRLVRPEEGRAAASPTMCLRCWSDSA